MEATVYISKSALDYFRSKARDCPHEIQAYLVGDYVHPNKYIVKALVHPREYAIQTSACVQPSGEDYARAKQLALDEGMRIIGDIHTHPNADPVMSVPDYEACMADGLQICGIVSVRGRKTQVRFWMANSALPCEVSYEAADLEEESV
jgi:proteasome lid subunit RPN8/RPN11